jgi:Arc/MetJ family transcription regulator
MRTTLDLDDESVKRAHSRSGLRETSVLVREALRASIERRLARLGETQPDLASAPRRRLDHE